MDLDRLGLIQAALYEPSEVKNKRGIYSYFPGEGIPSQQPTRHWKVTLHETMHCVRMFLLSQGRYGRWPKHQPSVKDGPSMANRRA